MTRDTGAAPGFPAGDWLDALVAQSLREDVGTGDVSAAVAVAAGTVATGAVVARLGGIVAGLPLVGMVYGALDPSVRVEALVGDGAAVAAGQELVRLEGPAASLLTGERTALNFVQHLGGIATQTARYVAAAGGGRCAVLDTRKTLPGYRLLAKYAVRCGGGANHRQGLYDRVLLKDNHWASGDSVAAMVARARASYPQLEVEVEVDTTAQLAMVLALGVEWIMLDNFPVADVAAAVVLRDATAPATKLEASGNVTLETIAAYARTGVDAVSVGRLTHSAPALDIGMDFDLRSGA
jgi:nicotinate-nucleotide pyrophosphorylase (carboxylating)